MSNAFGRYFDQVWAIHREADACEKQIDKEEGFIAGTVVAILNTPIVMLAFIPPLAKAFRRKLFGV